MSKHGFLSFGMAGFECTYAKVEGGGRLDMLAASRHDVLAEEDYGMIKEVGMLTVREGLAWHQIDKGAGRYDFSRFEAMMEAAAKRGIQQIWDLNHFDYPEYLDPFSQELITAFAAYAKKAIRVIRKYQPKGTLFIVPINEISFFAWIGADKGWWAPYAKTPRNGFRLKQQLVRAALAAMRAIWQVDEEVRFIQVDPFMRRMATLPAKKSAKEQVKQFNEVVRFEAWDMLAGITYPELGGERRFLDIIGVNYYIHNQEWVISPQDKRGSRHQMMDWDSTDRVSLGEMLGVIYSRYKRPMVITETGSFGRMRVPWWKRTLDEVTMAKQQGLPIEGVCVYPALDRPSHIGFLEANSGLWDFEVDDADCRRIPHEEALAVVKELVGRFTSK